MSNGLLSTLLSVCMALGMAAHGLELEYISPAQKQALEQDFAKADFSSTAASTIKQKKWTCDMYGVRSGLQVKHGLKLYSFTDDGFKNDGAQLVREYAQEKGALTGHTDRFEDEVKINAEGKLVSRLSVTRPERQVIAYAVCD